MIKVQRILLRAGVITLFMLAYLVFGSQTRVLATTGGYVAGSAQYHVTVTYDVDNSCDYKDYNYFLLYGPVKSKSFDQDDPSSYYTAGSTEQWNMRYDNVAKTAGKGQTKSNYLDTVPTGIRYSIQGDMYRICKYYIKRLEIEAINPIIDLGCKKWVLWDGEFGMKLATSYFLNPAGGDGLVWHVYSNLWLDKEKGPYFTPWTPNYKTHIEIGTHKKQETNLSHCAYDKYGGLWIMGITFPTAPDVVSVPIDNADTRSEFSAGVLYDQFGSMWPCQRFDISVNRVDKNITIEYDSSSKQWYMIVPPSANASEDYDVNIIQHTIKGTDFPTFAKVRVKTFDYNYTFKDENGNVIKRLTADYGQTVTAPDDTHTWVCDEYSNWQNTKDGPQDRVVYATQASEEFRKTVASARKLTVGNFKVEAKNNRMAAVSWKKNRDADGYQIWYSTDKKFKQSVKSIKIDKSNAKELLKKLKPGKKLYVKIRAYKRIKYPGSGKKITVYGEWSKVKSFKVK